MSLLLKVCKNILKNIIKNILLIIKLKTDNIKLFYIICLICGALVILKHILLLLIILAFPYYYLIKSKDYSRLYEMIKGIKVIKKEKNYIVIFSNSLTYTEILKNKEKFEMFFNRNISSILRIEKDFRYHKIFFKVNTKFKSKYYFQDYVSIDTKSMSLPLVLGIDQNNKVLTADLADLKHLFVGGESGGGKSVMLNCIIQSLMLHSDSTYIFVDLKQGIEMSDYLKFKNSIVISTIEEFEIVIANIKKIMIERLQLIRDTDDCKDIQSYNQNKGDNNIGYIIIVIDEIAEIKINSAKSQRSQGENDLLTILQQGRAAGVHVIAATQRSSADQLDTSIRAGFNKAISFKVGRIETQKMIRVLNTQDLKIGEFKTDIGKEAKIYKGFYIDSNHNLIYHDLKHVVQNGKMLFEILEKLEKKDTKHNNILHKLIRKVYKGYNKSYNILPSYNIAPKTPSNQVVDLIREIKKLSQIDNFSVENEENIQGGNYEMFLKFLLENYKEDFSLPSAKIIIEKCDLTLRKKNEFMSRAKDENLIIKKSATRFAINLKNKKWEGFR